MSGTEITSLRSAAKLAGVSPEAVRLWCEKFDIGELRGNRWHIRVADLNKIIRARSVLKL